MKNMKKKNVISQNYLERVPYIPKNLGWTADEKGIVTLETENKGVMNRIAQKLLKKPKISYIHLDEFGSFVWQIIDGTKTIIELGKEVEARFGEEANPLYERLAKFFQILDSYGFIAWNKE